MKLSNSLIWGILLCIIITIFSRSLVQLPVFSILGAMVTAILLGIACRALTEKFIVPGKQGIGFTAKYILRLGIILMGVRLNLSDILAAGWQTVVLDIAVIAFAISVISFLGRKSSVESRLTTLIAVGTGICGAAAIAAVGPLIKAKDEDVAVSVTIIATLGTIFTIIYSALLPFLGLSAHQFGTFAGSTLHELAHVIAAAAPGGSASSDIAIVVKLGRVAFLAPVAMLLGLWYAKQDQHQLSFTHLPIPWFIFGFLGMAILKTYNFFPGPIAAFITDSSIFLLTMAMAGLGLNVRLAEFVRVGPKPIIIGLIGSLMLSIWGWLLIDLLHI